VGDRFALDGFEGTVTRTAHRRVTEVRLRPLPAAEPGEAKRNAAKED
jgi:hypothetical protein